MNGVALRILLGDRAKYIGLIFGIAFSTMLMSNQISIFTGLMLRTAGQIIDAREADVWVMDPRVEYVDEIEPMTDMQLGRVRGVDGVDWAVPFFKGLTVAHARDGMLQQIILLGVDDATLTGVAPRLVLGSAENLKQPDAMIIDRAGFQFMWPGEAPGLGKVVELNDHRAVIAGISDASAPFTTSTPSSIPSTQTRGTTSAARASRCPSCWSMRGRGWTRVSSPSGSPPRPG